MLSLGISRAGLGRAASSVGRTYSTNSAKGPSSNRGRNVALASVISTMPGLWWFTATDDNIPLLKTAPVDHWDVEPGPSKDQVRHMISKGAYSFPAKSVAGVNRYDGTQLGSNSPCEDRFTHGKLPSPWNDGSQWMAWAIFDGHAGWQTADLLEKQLLPFVRHSLNQVKPSLNDESVSSDVVQRAIIKGFLNLDDSIIKTALHTAQSTEPLQEKVKKLMPAFAGSCALLSLYDPTTRSLHVACTGDSRAVLGQQLPNGTWEAIPLSVDQTGSNREEIARLYQEHPGEKEIVKQGRVLGLMVSRAFGDSRWKWPLDFQQEMKERFFGPSPLTPRYDVRTPPYLTAEPVVTTTKIDPGRPSFLIMASDGLWDLLSNQQAVDLVGKWVGSRKSVPEPKYEAFDFGQGVSQRFVEGRTTVQDGNSAVHLVRNSLGGNHHEMVAGRLAFSPPFSRHPRDDITVQVVFFNTSV